MFSWKSVSGKKQGSEYMLFKNITVIDENFDARSNMYVGVRDKYIEYISDAMPQADYGEVYDGTNKVMLPGFVNSHSHSAMCLMRGYGENMALSDWLNKKIFPFEDKLSDEAVYWATLLAMAESVRFGIVSSTDMYYFCDQVAEAVIEAGAKANISRAISHFSYEDLWGTSRFIEAVTFYKDYNGAADGRIKTDMSIHAEYTTTPVAVAQLAEYTKEIGANMHVHLSETKSEHEECKARHNGMTPAQYFNSLGIFETSCVAAHCVWIEGEDYDILKDKGVTAAVNPVSNLKLASGICNADKLLRKGINVAIGTDSVASNNSLNFIEEMKFFALATKDITGNPAVISPKEVLRAATLAGAKAQGRADTGLIKEGFKADIVVLDTDKPYMYPVHNILNNIVYSASGNDVVLTMCDGKILYRDGEYMTIDIEKTVFEAQRCTKNILSSL